MANFIIYTYPQPLSSTILSSFCFHIHTSVYLPLFFSQGSDLHYELEVAGAPSVVALNGTCAGVYFNNKFIHVILLITVSIVFLAKNVHASKCLASFSFLFKIS